MCVPGIEERNMNNMECDDQKTLLTHERKAWSAFYSLKDSGINDEKELARRHTYASDASTRLTQHISACPKCHRKSATLA